ncbi:MAG TPA: D-alanyl-D-alanine carboxypeptidase/D-alanyl-D-alanine-endopeptidase [Rhodocyclaceae bacterium]|jgi:D-alanyl-D-alanine carboxypeptidase/D-alanyl-D-alanine-endopeptidase (penicillin-binding protein 4)|nr:D-alanyl-D-alanine carboxypeptidase/D-alanyl-D-alanine-endopeptidase [Rhodocyclaceae bacterium]
MKAILFALACLSFIATSAHAGLPSAVEQQLKLAAIPQSDVSVIVQEAGAKRPVVQLNPDASRSPASIMKLVTTDAGLELLGPAYTWQTTAYARTAPVDGVLYGDLYLKGSGDPRLTFEQFWLLLRQLRANGLREIKGRLLLDRSAFNLPANNGDAPFDDQPMRPYNVKPDALLLNWKSIRLQLSVANDNANQKLEIQAEPLPANLNIVSQIAVIDGDCGEWHDRLRTDISPRGDRFTLLITGSYPKSCGTQTMSVGVLDHPQYVYGVFRQLWEELGGRIDGANAGSGYGDARVPPDAMQLGNIESAPLAVIIRDINKFSNNVMARQLFLTLGDGTPAGSVNAVKNWLSSKGLNFPELVLENGSGLSRTERISAQSLASLLNNAWQSPLMPEFVASLPLTGVDGTMKKRLKDLPTAGHIKTGTLDGVKSMAGYVRDKKGKWWIVVFIINHPNASAGQAAQDALLNWIAR